LNELDPKGNNVARTAYTVIDLFAGMIFIGIISIGCYLAWKICDSFISMCIGGQLAGLCLLILFSAIATMKNKSDENIGHQLNSKDYNKE